MIDREVILGELESKIDRGRWGSACGSMGGGRAKALMLGDVLYELFSTSLFGWFCEELYCFNGRVYEKMDPDLLRWVVSELLRRNGVEANIRVHLSDFVSTVRMAIKIECELKPRFDLRAFSNGVVDLKSGDIKPFSPQWPVMYEYPFAYEREADCPVWRSFLRRVLPEKNSRVILQMFMGLTVTDRSVVDVPLCLALYGRSVYAKSVVNELIRNLCGPENVSGESIESILREGQSGQKNRTNLMGKIVNVCSALSDKFVLAHEEEFNSYLKGAEMKARFSRGIEFTLRNVPWQIFNFDSFPVDDSLGGGIFRRFQYVIFNEFIPEREANMSIGQELKEELPGILNWCIRGARYARLHQYRFPSSENTERSRIESIGQENSLHAWMLFVKPSPKPRCDDDKPRWLMTSRLYDNYVKFCKSNGFEAIQLTAFGRFIKKYGFVGANYRRTCKGNELKVYGFSEDFEKEGNVKLSMWRVMDDAEFDDTTEEV